jgi:cytochrome b
MMTTVPIKTFMEKRVKVWDIGVRFFHWAQAALFVSAYFLINPRSVHRYLGYTIAGLLAFRLIWGLIGTKYARFSQFVPGPARLAGYLRDMSAGREERYLGHNPAGGAMIIALLLTMAGIASTGYMMGLDAFFGEEWVENLHKTLVNVMLLLIFTHLCGVIYSSIRHRENLVKAMITGEKRLED